MGGFLKRLGAGIAGGLSQYYGEQYRRQEEDRRAQVMMMREQALARFKQNLAEESADKQVGRQKQLISHTAEENRLSTKTEIGAREGANVRAESREEARTSRERSEEFKLWRQKQGITLEGAKALALFEAETAAKYNAGAGDPITHWDIDEETGTKVGFTKSGRVFDTGVKVPRKGAGLGSIEELLAEEEGAGGGAPAGPPARGGGTATSGRPGWRGGTAAASDGATDVQRALAELGTVYMNATPERYPGLFRNGKKISLEEARKAVERRFGQ